MLGGSRLIEIGHLFIIRPYAGYLIGNLISRYLPDVNPLARLTEEVKFDLTPAVIGFNKTLYTRPSLRYFRELPVHRFTFLAPNVCEQLPVIEVFANCGPRASPIRLKLPLKFDVLPSGQIHFVT